MAHQKSTPVTIPATQAQRKFGELVRRVFSGKEHFIVEKDGLPVMAVIPMAEYDEFVKERTEQEQDNEKRLKQFEDAARAIGEEIERRGLTEEDVEKSLEQAKRKVYQRYYGKSAK
jgi:prevent-host-death family protein